MYFVVLYYCISTLVYFAVGTGSLYWHLFNMLSILGTIVVFMLGAIFNKRYDAKTKGLAVYAVVLTIFRGIYSTACPHAPTDWIYFMNKIFALIFAVWLIIKIATRLYRSYSTSR